MSSKVVIEDKLLIGIIIVVIINKNRGSLNGNEAFENKNNNWFS